MQAGANGASDVHTVVVASHQWRDGQVAPWAEPTCRRALLTCCGVVVERPRQGWPIRAAYRGGAAATPLTTHQPLQVALLWCRASMEIVRSLFKGNLNLNS